MNPEFLDDLDLRVVPPDKWELLSNFRYRSGEDRGSLLITVPKGFVNDLASIPRVFRSLIPVDGKHRGAAVIHDYLYALKGAIPSDAHLTRKACDQIFLEAMKVSGVSFIKRHTMYQAVRVGGWVYFRE